MSKVVKLSDFSEKPENMYLEYMTAFWYEYDLYWELSNGGFALWCAYEDAGNKVLKSEMLALAAAANLMIIEYNKNRILEEGLTKFYDHISLLSDFYQINPSEITKMAVKLEVSILKIGFDQAELEWDDDAEGNELCEDDDYDDEELTPEMLQSAEEIMNKTCNLHVTIDFDRDTPITKEQCIQVITDLIKDNDTNVPLKLYTICVNDSDISFSIDCQLGFMVLFIEIMKNQYQVTPEFVVIRDLDENAFIPDLHYSSFMQYYRDMLTTEFEGEEDLTKYMEQFTSLSAQERRDQNPNPREDDEYAAIQLYDLTQEEGIAKAKLILTTNAHNLEAQILIAGWEGDLEKRIDLLAVVTNVNILDYDYKRIQIDKMWWKASHTRPFMRAKYLLAKTYELGGYFDDALDGYKEIIDMNPDDNLGARIEMMRILYKIDDKKAIISLVNKYPNEVDEYFSFAGVYAAFMKYGKSSKTEKKIIFSFQTNYYLACAIAKIDPGNFTDLISSSVDDDEVLFNHYEKYGADILPLFKNVELAKYYRKVVKELLDRIGN